MKTKDKFNATCTLKYNDANLSMMLILIVWLFLIYMHPIHVHNVYQFICVHM
mgnify:CR=1 FL=1